MQYSSAILDELVAPNLSKLTACGAKPLKNYPNYFSEFILRSKLGPNKYKPAIEALIVNFYRRVDFACVEYRAGQKRLSQYCKKLPESNSETRFFRLAVSHFETCILHVAAANKCSISVLNIIGKPMQEDNNIKQIRLISNAIRHFDENVEKTEKKKGRHFVSPVWITDRELHCYNAHIGFDELHKELVNLILETKHLATLLK